MKVQKISLIKGGSHLDERGVIKFVNDFNMASVKRFYQISHNSVDTIRAWQGHKKEQKWFHCTSGEFEVQLIKIDDWENPSNNLEPKRFILSSEISEVLHIPEGFVNGFRAKKENSILLVFSNFGVEDSKNDDFRFDKDYWKAW